MTDCKGKKMFRFLVPLLVLGMLAAAARRHHRFSDEGSSERRFGRHFERPHFMHKHHSMVV